MKEENFVSFSDFEMVGQLWPGPVYEKNEWWGWGKSTEKKVIWDGWYKGVGGEERLWREIHNLQITFDDYNVVGYGRDFHGDYTIEGTSAIDGDKWRLNFN